MVWTLTITSKPWICIIFAQWLQYLLSTVSFIWLSRVSYDIYNYQCNSLNWISFLFKASKKRALFSITNHAVVSSTCNSPLAAEMAAFQKGKAFKWKKAFKWASRWVKTPKKSTVCHQFVQTNKVSGGLPSQRTNNVESVPMSWRRHEHKSSIAQQSWTRSRRWTRLLSCRSY